ncbi:hypothetical protein KO507_02490 [Gilvimarinus agarilyticus]|uniref:hypothetical protein n=1 Tax=Gilvimarinus sp. 2_MG-2023 TaxID=3062666 RepID=UPI001C080A46|nr:hypothetical protein [Gilvimarinus sp. 2_MG-2023]MBU2884628.1 hypothetical protein [Gilvimarinus agarilyticus]MDO6569735.1 hypothetical protein [Gilvimarinus sp. 2_MG-2023]
MLRRIIVEEYINSYRNAVCEEMVPKMRGVNLLSDDFSLEESEDSCFDQVKENFLAESVAKVHNLSDFEIEEDENILEVFRISLKSMGVKGKVSSIKLPVNWDDKKVNLSFVFDGERYRFDWDFSVEVMPQQYIDFINSIFSECTGNVLIKYSSNSFFVAKRAQDEIISEFLDVCNYQNDLDLLKIGNIVASAVISVIGFTITFIGGWVFYGFITGLIASLVIWGVIFIGYYISHAYSTKKKKSLNEKVSDSSEFSGADVANLFVREAVEMEDDSVMGKRLKKMQELKSKGLI